MATQIPDVRVTRVEAGQGFLVTCSRCPDARSIRPTRIEADLFATRHQADHTAGQSTRASA